jgi:cephalosporin hydroxylase
MLRTLLSGYRNYGGLFGLRIPWKVSRQFSVARPKFSPRPALLEVDKWALSSLVLHVSGIIDTHPYPVDELLLMAAAFEYHRPEVVIDIGTHMGKSARMWWEMASLLGESASIHTFDICDPKHPEFPGQTLGRFIKRLPIRQHIRDGYEGALEIIQSQPQARYLVFLDGDHSFRAVRRELELAKLLPSGSGILVHDTFFQPGSSYNHGPFLAVEEFRKEFTFKQVIHLQSGLPGMSYLSLR